MTLLVELGADSACAGPDIGDLNAACGIMKAMPYGMPEPPRLVCTASGRTVSCYEYGDPDGTPVFALHGTPASGSGFVWASDAAHAQGIWLIAPDRPGVGRSDPLPRDRSRTVSDYAGELVAVADAMNIASFGVLGYSGGGPYSVAVAHACAERVNAAAVVAGAGHVGEWASIDEFEEADRRLTRLSLRAPLIARTMLAISARTARLAPRVVARLARQTMTRDDAEVIARFDSAQAALAVFTTAITRSAAGVVDDYAVLGRAWGFAVEDITVPLRCWHAVHDPIVPIRHSEELVARVSHAELVRWSTGGHLAVVDHIGDVFEWLAAHASQPDDAH